ncbi:MULTISPECIES: DUF2290 domain-containing protein [Pseudomonas]|uniref:DUF2290 domain-containing protein n=1 Tax=Pseudomonas cedrina TaxID=651740 RepID=A0A2S9E423_PSECE|nr:MULTISPECIES: DUF2290 domain-containing protein [Pseudomonas]AVJ25226.1 hypothetical protein CLM72_27325 [Pseudomonas sp. MYb193]PRC09585.1 hypothetical protein CQ006_03795 [Pseudomonas cedrina]
MPAPEKIRTQVEKLTADFIGLGLCNSQNFPSLKSEGSLQEVSYSGTGDLSFILKNQPYQEIYNEILRTNAYNLKMLDGALIQLMYKFENGKLKCHRLAFFPSPDLTEYQNNPEIYEDDEIYADIVMRNIVVFPIRFDFDITEGTYKEIDHPKSHLTLGQYKNCRIPVSAPVTPHAFLAFLLRNFYHTAFKKHADAITIFDETFEESIYPSERLIGHFNI